ncbi:hypothetical protein ACQPXS_47225 (plasmid) [Streptomyces sp. CA-142005]|uniref:hypothetical protein n=1 Tax=Streptomyces sp. CA-142005 TaxID=3240052 RepID=UPI003D912D61
MTAHAAGNVLVVDADDPTTWPQPFAAFVQQRATEADLEELDLYVDLPLHEHEDEARRMLAGHLVRVRHCTRLLDHEAEMIRAQGLRPLDLALVHERLDQALERGLLTEEQHAMLARENSLTHGRWGRRDGQVCLVLSTAPLEHNLPGVRRFFSFWGGEAIYWRYHETHPELAAVLSTIGRPALVTALLDLSDPTADHRIFPSLLHAFVGKALGYAPADAEVFYRASVPGNHVENIAFPGQRDYDRFPLLPRS